MSEPEPQTPQSVKSKRYHRFRRMGSVTGFLLSTVLLWVFVLSGGSLSLRALLETYGENEWFLVAAFVTLFLSGGFLLFLPLNYLLDYRLPHRFGLSNENLRQWMWEKTKGLLLAAALGSLGVEFLYLFLRKTGDQWWWIAALAFVLFAVGLTRLAPTLLFPFFFRFKPLEEGDLKIRLMDLSRKAQTGVVGVFEMDLSRKTRGANAALAGLGKSKRIILSDTLIRGFTVDEIEVVTAHELGHHVQNHLWKLIGLQAGVTALGFYLCHLVLGPASRYLGYRGIADVAGFPLMVLVVGGAGLILSPLTAWISRSFERASDRYAIGLTRNPGAFVSSMKKLADLNLAETDPPPWIEFLFHGHPSIARRIRFAEGFSVQEGDLGGG